jgi:hypothetical protein
MAAIAPRLHPVRWAISNKDMSVAASKLTILRISDSCKAHPCLATTSLLLPRGSFQFRAGTILLSGGDLSNGTQVLWDFGGFNAEGLFRATFSP